MTSLVQGAILSKTINDKTKVKLVFAVNVNQKNVKTIFYNINSLFYFICHTIITKNIGKVEKKKWQWCGSSMLSEHACL